MLPLWITLGVNHFVVLETIADFVHLNPLVVCAPWFIVLHVFVLLPSRWLHQVNRSVGKFALAVRGSNPSSPRMTVLSLKRRCHEQAFS
jgi:hypothetical protein